MADRDVPITRVVEAETDMEEDHAITVSSPVVVEEVEAREEIEDMVRTAAAATPEIAEAVVAAATEMMVIVMAVDRAADMEEATAEIMATTMQQPAGLTGGKTKLLLSFAISIFLSTQRVRQK